MKISFFWSRIPHYAQACLRELMNQSDHSINIYSLDHPPDFFKEKLIDFVVLDPQDPDFYQQCQEALNASDLIVASGWMYKNFCRALSEVKKTKKLTSICMADTPWKDSLKQEIRAHLGKVKVNKLYDIMWVPGARSIPLSRKLGYTGKHLWQGLYCADTDKFLKAYEPSVRKKKSFVFVGRLVEAKNISGLLQAYKIYQKSVKDPWSLEVIGDGPLKHLVPKDDASIISHGALSPDQMLPIFKQASCFILPSHFEPWGVVVHEAACLGLPIIASQDVCATAELVRDGFNGRIVDSKSPQHMAQAMQWLSEHQDLEQLSRNSFSLAQSNSVQNWAQMFLTRLEEMG